MLVKVIKKNENEHQHIRNSNIVSKYMSNLISISLGLTFSASGNNHSNYILFNSLFLQLHTILLMFYTIALFSFGVSCSTFFIALAMFCSLDLCTGSLQLSCAGHPQISPTTTRHKFKSLLKHTSKSPQKQTSTLFSPPQGASFTVIYAQGRDLVLTHGSSLLHTHIQTYSKSEISLSYPHSAL